jgi:hypothetical protein
MVITNTMKEKLKILAKNDGVVVWGGTRDVDRNDPQMA